MKPASATKSNLRSLWAIPLVGAVVVAFSILWVFVISDEERYPAANPVSMSMAAVTPHVVMVLPFTDNGSPDGSSPMALQVHTGLVVYLSQIDGIQMVSDQDDVLLDGHLRGLASAGASLAVGGTVQEEGGRVRVSVRLTEVSTDKMVWSGNFEEATEDMFRLRSMIAQAVTKELRGRIRSGEQGASPGLADRGQPTT